MSRIPEFSRTVLPDRAVGGAAISAARAQYDINAQNIADSRESARQISRNVSELQLRDAEAKNTTAVNESAVDFKMRATELSTLRRQERMANPDNFAKDFDTELNSLADEYVMKAPSEAAKIALRDTLTRQRSSIFDTNSDWQQTRKVEMYGASLEKTAKTLGNLSYQRGMSGEPVDDLYRDAEATTVAASTIIAPEKLDKVRDTIRNTIREGQIEGMITRNPVEAVKALDGMGGAYNKFDQSVSFVMNKEGGFVSNDAGKGPTNLGINQEANPDIDVKSLTPERARELYKDRYWNAIGADNLPPALAMIAFDGAVNQGVGATKEMLEKAGGDPLKLIALREDRYRQTAQNPAKAKYLDGWLARLDEVGQHAQIMAATGPSDTGAGGDTLPFEKIVELRKKAQTYIKQDIELRDKDPMTYAQVHGLTPNAPLDFSNPAALKEQFKSRAEAATTLTTNYGAPLQVLTEQEAKNFSAMLAQQTTKQRVEFLSMMRDSFDSPRHYQAALQQIRPDSPVTAMAGMYIGMSRKMPGVDRWFGADVPEVTPELVAQRVLEGEDLINPVKAAKQEGGSGKPFPMPPDGDEESLKGIRSAFASYVGDAYRGQPQAAAQAYQAYRAFYAAEAAKRGIFTGTKNDEVAQLAMRAVTGGIGEKNGKKFVMPWGMDEVDFNDAAAMKFSEIKKEFGLERVHWDDVILENTGEPGRYRMVAGIGYLVDAAGNPFTLKFD